MEPNPRTPSFYHAYLEKRWAEGTQHGYTLLKEIQELGYMGCFHIGEISRSVAQKTNRFWLCSGNHKCINVCKHDRCTLQASFTAGGNRASW